MLAQALPLSLIEARVLGTLLEKDITTPEYYPLSLNALTTACNQKTNRDPVTDFSDAEVREALELLRHKGLSFTRTGAGSRVEKFGHRLSDHLNLGRRQLALLTVLLLRGPQTPGELHTRTERMHEWSDIEEVIAVLDQLMQYEGLPLVARLPKAPGMKEARYGHLLSGEPVYEGPSASSGAAGSASGPVAPGRLQTLEAEVESLKRRLDELEAQWTAFRRQFE